MSASGLNCKTSYVQDDGRNGEKLPGRGELHTVVKLFPVCEESGFSLVGGLKGSTFNSVHKDVHSLWTQTGIRQVPFWLTRAAYQRA